MKTLPITSFHATGKPNEDNPQPNPPPPSLANQIMETEIENRLGPLATETQTPAPPESNSHPTPPQQAALEAQAKDLEADIEDEDDDDGEEATKPTIEALGPKPDAKVKPPKSSVITAADLDDPDDVNVDDFEEDEQAKDEIKVVEKPDSNKRFWACPNKEYTRKAWVWRVDNPSGIGKVSILVTKAGRPFVPKDRLTRVLLTLCRYYGEDGEYFVWLMNSLSHELDNNIWTLNKHKILRDAKIAPVRMYSRKNKAGKNLAGHGWAIVPEEVRGDLLPAVWPDPEKEPFDVILTTAFENQVISGPDFPLLKPFKTERHVIQKNDEQ
jgi:hypothetical protein